MKLLDAVKSINVNDKDMIEDILFCLTERLEWLEEREPESDGIVYDDWSEKHDEWDEIVEVAERLTESENEREKKDLANDLKERIESFQLVYKGISRLRI